MLRNCCWLISRSGIADSGQIISCEWPICGWVSAVGFQGVDQLLLVPLHGLWDIALHQRDLGRALRQQLIPLDIAQRERQGEQQRGNSQRLPVTLDEGQGQQAANHHQQEVDRLDAHHRRETFQRAVDLAIAELQPWEAGQHPAAQELGDLPDDGGGDSHPQPAGFGPQPESRPANRPV